MAETAPPPSIESRIQRWLEQDGASQKDVSHETSSAPVEEPEPEAAAEESDDYQPQPNAQPEGDETSEPEPIRSFADLAKRLEIDEMELSKLLTVKGRDDKDVSLHDLLSEHRAPRPDKAQAERQLARLAELEAGEQQRAQAMQALAQAAQGLAQRLKTQQPDWATLERANPQEYISQRLKWMDHLQQLEAADRQLQAEHQRQSAEQQRQLQAFRREQAEKMRAAVPEWSDLKVMETDLGKVAQFLLSRGVTQDEIAGLSDHRDWLIARDAMRWQELQDQKPALQKKLAALPKVIAPGAAGGADRGSAAQRAKAEGEMLGRLKESGKAEDAAALIAHRLENSRRRAAGRTLASGRRS